jgi:3-dehydroquinate dehydratase type I
MAKICVSVLPKNMGEALNFIEKAEEAEADLLEVRLDFFERPPSLSDLAESTNMPLVATNKLRSENGYFAGSESKRQQSLLKAAENGFEYVDVDVSSPWYQETIGKLRQLGAKPIASYHKLDGPLSLSRMDEILNEQIASGASVCKIVTTAKRVQDNLPILNFVSRASGKAKLVCFCMGEHGKISRLLSPMFGAFFTFASLEQGDETAAGQMSISEMKAAYAVLVAKQ